MSGKATKELLETLHGAVAADLLDKIRSGEAKSSDLSVAVKFLKDNNIEQMITEDSNLKNLFDSLPFDAESLSTVLAEKH
jgi:predicted nucleotidyltransferase